MALTPFSGGITAAILNANADDRTVSLLANAKAGQKDGEIPLRLASLASGADLSLRSIAWTQQDDQELRLLALRVTDTGAGRAVTATLTVDNGDDTYLVEHPISVAITTVIGTADGRTGFRTTTGIRVRLLKGVRYRLAIQNTSGSTINGPLQAVVQLRSRRRSEARRTQMPYVPRVFRSTENLDPESLNDNFRRIARDIAANLDQRYTYGPPMFLPLDGMTNASAQVLREFAIRRQAAALGLEVCSYEIVVYATAGVTWTLTPSDTTMPAVSVLTVGATTEAYAELAVPIPVSSAAADLLLTATADAASTITRGYIVVHTRADRGNMGSSHAGYAPAMIDASTARDGATLDAIFTGLGLAADRDAANDKDLRVECFAIRTLASGSSVTLLLPSGARRILGTVAYIVGGVGTTATVTVTGTGLSGSSVAVVGTGATNRVAGTDSASGSLNDDPTDSADDATVTIAITGGGTANLAYVLVFWS